MATTRDSKSIRPTPTQARAARRTRRQRRRRLLRWGGLSILGVVSFAFIIGLFLPSVSGVGGGGGGLSSFFGGGAPDGPGIRVEDAGAPHVSPDQPHAEYTSVPATSGPMFGGPLGPTRWGIHDQQLQDEVFVHNLEHGGVGIFYDCPEGCPELVTQLSDIVDRGVQGGLKILMAPYAGMERRISLNAWTFLDQFDEFDEDRVRAFIDSHESSPNSPEAFAR